MAEKDVLILAIESSCDETAAAVVKNGREVLSNVNSSQIALHTLYGGVVPEIAEVTEMWLTHYSPSLTRAENYMDDVHKIFPAAFLGKDGRSVELEFEEDE